MANTFPGPEVKVTGENLPDAVKRARTLQKIQDTASTEELEKIGLMASEKGRKALKTKWNIIKKFI